jgi:HNH endonuclease
MIAKGFCQMHYRRMSIYGDPLFVQKVQRSPYDSSEIVIYVDYATVELTQGKLAVIDLSDIEKIRPYNWNYSSSTGYAYSNKIGTSMHQFLIGRAPTGMQIDHVDRDKLNNRRKNIKFATFAQNNLNSERSDNSGISYHSYSGKYQAYVWENGKQTYLGLFITKELARAQVEARKLMRKRGRDEETKADE